MIGLNVFKEYFKEYVEQYVLIGGAGVPLYDRIVLRIIRYAPRRRCRSMRTAAFRSYFGGEPIEVQSDGLSEDRGSVIADPLFVSPETQDYTVADGSPAIRLGFRRFAQASFRWVPVPLYEVMWN